MSLSASMWTSVSGLLSHGEKMNVIGHNISNVNTVGYKNQRMDFQDFVYQYVGTAAGMGQVGRGTSIGIVMNDFSQGSFETTTNATDIAIEGNGFFSVKPKTNNTTYYTRAGNFRFDREGFLVDPHQYVLQGLVIDRNFANQIDDSINRGSNGIIGTGAPVDVKLDTFTCPPRHTTNIVLPLNLRSSNVPASDDKTQDIEDPFFALLKNWDATQQPALGTDKYAYQTTMEVYDEGGRMHKLTVYFDRVVHEPDSVVDDPDNQEIVANSDSESYWEYIITMDPSEDYRDFNSVYDPEGNSPTAPNVPDKLRGLLGAGTITFSSSGVMKDMTCFVPDASMPTGAAPAPGDPPATVTNWWQTPAGATTGVEVNLDRWIAAPISSNGYPMIAPNFSGTGGLQNAYTPVLNAAGETTGIDYAQPNKFAADRMIAIDFGLKVQGQPSWTFAGDPGDPNADPVRPAATPVQDAASTLVSAGAIGTNKYFINGLGSNGEVQPTSTTCLGDNFYEKNGKKQDGYTYGDLRYVSVASNGVLSAAYSNGVTLQLFQLLLYDFPSTQNLRREGGNLFTETRESGSPSNGAPGTGTFGTTHGSSLEQSNADLSREFVNMITTQRGFQANSKTITTVDTMLETVIAMKR